MQRRKKSTLLTFEHLVALRVSRSPPSRLRRGRFLMENVLLEFSAGFQPVFSRFSGPLNRASFLPPRRL